MESADFTNTEWNETAIKAKAETVLAEKTDRISKAFHMATGRAAKPTEWAELKAFLDAQLADSSELSAWTMLASLLLNLDEVQTLH